jgi:hypothetical protein
MICIFLSENVINCDYFFSGSLSNVIKCEKNAIFHSLRHFQNKLFLLVMQDLNADWLKVIKNSIRLISSNHPCLAQALPLSYMFYDSA